MYVTTPAAPPGPAAMGARQFAGYRVLFTRNGKRLGKRFSGKSASALARALAFQRGLPWGADSRLVMDYAK